VDLPIIMASDFETSKLIFTGIYIKSFLVFIELVGFIDFNNL